ncbi:MAG TPA: polysaccharide biosynthesis/export family protein [Pirellulales bacterium]|nr:polysaccharide biosynthesis/export family protein [Pirellulales bacterium]
MERRFRRLEWLCLVALAVAVVGMPLALVARSLRERNDVPIRQILHTENDLARHAVPLAEQAGYVTLCQALGPAAPYPVKGLDCATGACGEMGWPDARPVDWQRYAQGEYLGHARTAHVSEYRLRVGDVLDFVFRLTRMPTSRAYRLKVGDRVRLELLADPTLTSELEIQADGNLTLPLAGPVHTARLTVPQLRSLAEERYSKYYKQPTVTITPLKLNSRLEDLRASIDRRFGQGGQTRRATVTPEGTVQLPVVQSVSVQGLTLAETQREIESRVAEQIDGVEITPVLVTRAPRYVYLLGEVRRPGRYELVAPTTVMQAIALAGGWNYGGNLWHTVIFRRGDDWRLIATQLDLRGSLYGHRPCPADEIWINDSDVVLVPKSRVLVAENIIALMFVEGVFHIAPFHSGFANNMLRYRGTLPHLPFLPSGPSVIPIIAPTSPAAPSIPTPPIGPPAAAPTPTVTPLPTPPIPLAQ